jgi:hypothetical protein
VGYVNEMTNVTPFWSGHGNGASPTSPPTSTPTKLTGKGSTSTVSAGHGSNGGSGASRLLRHSPQLPLHHSRQSPHQPAQQPHPHAHAHVHAHAGDASLLLSGGHVHVGVGQQPPTTTPPRQATRSRQPTPPRSHHVHVDETRKGTASNDSVASVSATPNMISDATGRGGSSRGGHSNDSMTSRRRTRSSITIRKAPSNASNKHDNGDDGNDKPASRPTTISPNPNPSLSPSMMVSDDELSSWHDWQAKHLLRRLDSLVRSFGVPPPPRNQSFVHFLSFLCPLNTTKQRQFSTLLPHQSSPFSFSSNDCSE